MGLGWVPPGQRRKREKGGWPLPSRDGDVGLISQSMQVGGESFHQTAQATVRRVLLKIKPPTARPPQMPFPTTD